MTAPIDPGPTGSVPAAPVAPAGQAPTPPTPAAPVVPAAPPTPAAPAPPVWTPPAPAPMPVESNAGQEPGSDRDLSSLPQWAQQQIKSLREEAATRRIAARTAQVNQAAFAAAAQLGVNPHALLGSAAFGAVASQLDPASGDFGAQLAARVGELLSANPWMAAQPAAPAAPPAPSASGGEFPGGTGAGAPITEEMLGKMTPEQISEAFQAGRLKHLL